MRKILLSLTAATAIVSAASLIATRADAATSVGAAASILAAADSVTVVESARRRCWHRPSSRERCRWYRHWRW